MPNRSMQVKFDRAKAQRSAIMQDVMMKETQVFKEGLAQSLDDLVAAYRGPITIAKKPTPRPRANTGKMTAAAMRSARNMREITRQREAGSLASLYM